MSDTLQHRGPDGEGYFFHESPYAEIGLAHRRLSIIDLSEGGHQPMQWGAYTITYNGEIYNYREIRADLIKLGHVFISESDTEVILHAFHEWGTEAVQRFIGMFAFVLYDQERERIFCFRDRAGAKPFYYYEADGVFLFASELKAILPHPAFKKELYKPAVSQFFTFGYLHAPDTIFKNCNKIRPGHYLQINLKTRELRTSCYWNIFSFYNKPPLDISYEEAQKTLISLFQSAFQYRMVSDVPVGIFLSGGYDSSLVTAFLQHQSSTPLHTFTIGFKEKEEDETASAEAVAKLLGTNHTSRVCRIEDAIELIPTLPDVYDEPLMDHSVLPSLLVSKLARSKVTVALSADAGDELFAGYTTYDYLLHFSRITRLIPKGLLKAGSYLLQAFPSAFLSILSLQASDRKEKIQSLLKAKNILDANDRLNSLPSQHRLLTAPYKEIPYHPSYHLVPASDLHSLLAHDYLHYLSDDVLMKVDRAGMSVSLENREPFLDHRIAEFAASLPASFKYLRGSKKRILRDITHNYLPVSLMNRPKKGFSIPIQSWISSGHFDPFFETYFSEKALRTFGILDFQQVKELRTFKGPVVKSKALQIWQALVFQLWAEKWL